MQYVGLVGITLIVTSSRLFARLRVIWPEFLGCPMCVGFWIGCFAYLLREYASVSIGEMMLLGGSVSVLSYSTHVLTEAVESLKDFLQFTPKETPPSLPPILIPFRDDEE